MADFLKQSRRFLANGFFIVGLLCLSVGCQTLALPGRSVAKTTEENVKSSTEKQSFLNSLFRKKKASPSQTSSETVAKNPVSTVKPVDNPFSAKTVSLSQQAKQAVNNTTRQKPVTNSMMNNHDAETLMLIQSEFRDASQQEREEWFRLLREIPPERVPQILSVRRLMKKKQSEAAAQPFVQSPSSLAEATRNKNASGSLTEYLKESPSASNVSSPVGAASPWAVPAQKTNVTPKINPLQASTSPQNPKQPAQQISLTNSSPQSPQVKLLGIDDRDLPPQPPSSPTSSSQPMPRLQMTSSPHNEDQPVDASQLPPGVGIPLVSRNGVNVNPNTMPLTPPTNTAPSVAKQPSLKHVPSQLASHTKPATPSKEQSTGTEAWKMELQKLIAISEAEIARSTLGKTEDEKLEYVSRQVYLRMLYLMDNQQGRALQAIEHLPPAEQEFWQQTFWGIANYFDKEAIPAASDRSSQTITQLSTAIQSLKETANLELRNVNFCSKISSFGNYDKFDHDEFKPGQRVLIYGELKNFQSEPNSDGMFRTVVKSTVEIYKAGPQGGLIASNKFNPTQDLCRSKRNDYFHSYMINIPERIGLGPHILKLNVEDQLSQKIATYTLKFNVN